MNLNEKWKTQRKKFWVWLLRIGKHPEGTMLSGWLLIMRASLFPLDSLYWLLSKERGYQFYKDTWIIEGQEYSGHAMRWIATANADKTFKILKRENGLITIEEIK